MKCIKRYPLPLKKNKGKGKNMKNNSYIISANFTKGFKKFKKSFKKEYHGDWEAFYEDQEEYKSKGWNVTPYIDSSGLMQYKGILDKYMHI